MSIRISDAATCSYERLAYLRAVRDADPHSSNAQFWLLLEACPAATGSDWSRLAEWASRHRLLEHPDWQTTRLSDLGRHVLEQWESGRKTVRTAPIRSDGD